MNALRGQVEFIVLGSGTSHGVPMIGCRCAVCTSADPRDQRTRPSIWVRLGRARLLVDTAPELRLQCTANDIDGVDAVLFTHQHADHVFGFDDLRRFNWLTKRPVPCYGTERTLSAIRQMFSYAFNPSPGSPHSRPNIETFLIDDQPFFVAGECVIPIPLMHGPLPVMGFRFGDFAYCTDCNFIPESSWVLLHGLDVLILDALRRTPHPAHFNLEQAVDVARRIGARRTFFTHITHELPHQATNAELPEGMALAYDGLRLVTQSDFSD